MQTIEGDILSFSEYLELTSKPPADPVVWVMLFSRMVVLNSLRPTVMAITAIGMEAETVSPAFNARYTVAAPKAIPKMLPMATALKVNSFICVSGLTNG